VTDAVVVCSHLPGEGHFHSERFRVAAVVCEDDYAYWRGLHEHWDSPATICNAEHDMEFGDEHIATLLDCPYPLCSWAYHGHWISTHLPGPVVAAGAGARDVASHPDAYYLQGGEECAAWSAIGLVKVTPRARTGPLRREPWNTLELAVNDAVRGPWHMHWPPVIHHHW
jgi:hypothetical protein